MKSRILYAILAMATVINPIESKAGEIQFVEDFVLANDRDKAIEQLIPGTDVYYFFQCVHFQNTQRYEDVNKLLVQWEQRHGETESLREIRHRQMLLTYAANPKKTLDYLIQELQPNLNHQRDQLESKPQLPAKLDPKKISYETLKKLALRRHRGVKGFADAALDGLRASDLDATRRRELLSRLTRPTHPELVELIAADLNHKGSRGFGSLGIHRQLLLEQLDDLIRLRPKLENETNFVNTYLQKLQPNPDVDWQNDATELEAYLSRMWSFVARLNPSHNSLKAHVLYHQLTLDEKQGKYNKRRFLEYLALPRQTHYIQPRLMEDAVARRYPVDLGLNPGSVTQLPPISNDEALVRRYFLHLFQTENNYQAYELYIRDLYLRHLFAEAKITAGLGDPEKWYSLLPPAQYQALKERIDLDFALTIPQVFKANDPIQLDLHVKNVDKLIVKVYEVNTRNYYQQYKREVNTDIKLDGLIANHEATYEYNDAPVIRKRRHFEFPELQKPGVYVIDFIGNGKSSRAVVRKGQLHYLVQTLADGHVFSVFNDQLQKLHNVSLWMAGQQFESEDNGRIVVPFSTAPERQSFVLTHGNLSSLHSFEHQGENYEFTVAAHIDREALLDRQEAVLMLRPQIRLSGVPVSTQILEEVQVTVRSTTLDGVKSEKVYDGVKLQEAKDTPLVFLVPSRLAAIQVDVSAKIVDAKQKQTTVTASHQFTVNQIDKTDKIEDVHLTKLGDTHILQLLGKTGEPKPHRPIQLVLRHSHFADTLSVDLATDENGIVDLGALRDITQVVANGPNTAKKTWTLGEDRRTQTRLIHARAGEAIQVPHMAGNSGLAKSEASLYELRGGSYANDASKSIKISDHFVELKNLKPGDYSLEFNGQRNRIRVTRGKDEAGFVLGNLRRLEMRKLRPVHLTSIVADGDALNIQLENTSKFTRVHVYASRFFPAFDPYQVFSSVREVEPLMMRTPAQRSYYMAGRKLGDELQYVLERGYATKYPGNMLERPTMLLNSWPMRSTETTTHAAEDGEEFDAAAATPESMLADRGASPLQREAGQTDFANLDFLAEPTMLIANQIPDENGRISIPLEDLGAHHHFHVVAVDPLSTVYRSMALSEVTTPIKDLRLKRGLDPEKHYTQQKTITQLSGGETFEMADITTGRFDTYDSLGGVYSLYATLSGNDVLRQFQFIVDWPTLSTDEKKEKYSEFACHELNFFLYKKDREFFHQIVQPYIANKQHKTFLDLWLLESDLMHFLQPWEYTQLNTSERLLLGERIDGEDARVRRLVEDLFGLIPRDVSRQNLWFETAIQGKSLEHSDKLGFVQQQQDAVTSFGYDVRLAAPALRGAGSGGRSRESLGIQVEEEAVQGKDLLRRNLARKSRMKAQSGRYESFGDDADDAGTFNERLLEGRGRRRQLYEKLEKTQEWAENNYYRLPIEAQDEHLINVNAFWQDYAQRETNKPFFSISWPTATRNFSEMMFALSLLDLPFESAEHTTEFVDQRMTLTAGGPMIVFQEQIRETESSDEASPILITQNFFRADDRYQMVQGERRDKFVTDEFLAHVVYGCQVVLTNPTSSQRKVQLLLQVPHESLPTNGGKATQTVEFDLAPYHTQTVDYFFYFPSPGEYKHFPAHVAQGETLLAHADPTAMKVVTKPSNIDTQSWDYVSQFASDSDVIEFLNKNNVFEIDLERIAFRMGQKAFFTKTIDLLEKRHAYAPALWAYGIKHNIPAAIATYLKQNDQFLSRCGETLDSDLVDIDPVIRRTYQHLDYKPLVNARAHRLGGRQRILNNRFDQQYHELLEVLKYRRELNNQDRMAMTYYLLLQDRVEEAIEMFSAVERSNLDTQIQYDYFAAYLDCFRDEPSQARAIVTQYVNYPVPKWNKAFANVKSMLDEIDGNDLLVVDPKDRTQTQTAAAAEQVNFDFIVEDKQIRVDYQNVDNIQVNYYLIDLELLFSSNPFVQKFSGQFSHIRPNETQRIPLPADGSKHAFELPNEFHNRNLLVEIVAGGITRSKAYFSNSLTVQVSDNYGQLKVADTASGKPIPKTYVKVYAEMQDGRTLFYKDGYTDLRGRFDYSSLSTNELDFVKRFSMLILDESRGGLVREAQVPKR